MVEKLLRLGPRDAMIADLAGGVLSGEKHSIVIGEDLLDRIKFIREGEFSEKSGETTLKLVGEVQAINAATAVLYKGFATTADLSADFLEERSPYDPKDYIRCAVEVGNGAWLPMHFYAQKASLNRKGFANFIKSTKVTAKRKETYVARALGTSSAFHKASGGALPALEELKGGKIPSLVNIDEAANVDRAIRNLETKPHIPLKNLLSLLKDCWSVVETIKPNILGVLIKAITQVDELYFSSKIED